ncbi:hypothetical protein FK178_10715 [Antarcticibacterium arcticum]|uniref:Uncharacterized protein n=1 Tax=Antarcticibacterium arcticum TaxID=2585771 RepID=A0A5B8YQE9_9FLAO|nr:hypothetical protein [Antarcticibacterium arcticum]QED38159.1 hypothetical protein FK178_10715 [Antarcticibacterium arcticum]
MKKLLLSFAVLLILVACGKDRETSGDLGEFIPLNSSYIISSPNLADLLKNIDSLSFFKDNEFLINPEILSQLKSLSEFTGKEPSLICLTKGGDAGLNYLYISKGHPDQIKTDSIKNKSVETFTYDSFSINKFSLEEVTFFTSHRNGVLLAGNSRSQLEEIMKSGKKGKNETFDKVFAAADKRKSSLFVNHEEFNRSFKNSFPGSALPLAGLAGWSVLDIDMKGQKILLNGISVWGPQDKAILEAFRNVNPVPNQLADITPTSAAGFYSFTYNSFEKLHSNLQEVTETPTALPDNHFLNFTQEAGVIFLSAENVVAFTATDMDLAQQAITQESELSNEFRNIPIYRFNESPQILRLLNPLMIVEDYLHFAYVGNSILFAKSSAAIEEIITFSLNKTILSEQEFFQDAMSHLASSSSFLMVSNSENIKPRLKATGSEDILEEINSLDLKNYPILAVQFVQEGDFAHLHGIMNTTKSTSSNGVKEIAAFNTDSPIGTTAFLVKNHTNNAIEVAVQDEKNELYLFNAAGKRLWKTSLEGRISGKILQVDARKNGSLQLVFSTQNALYNLDRAGKSSKPFPINFKDDITQPLSVFDYDNNRNYRLVITQDRDVIMYDAKGAQVKGFDFGKTSAAITESPQHIRMKNKDYIVVPEDNGKMNILSRQGTSRVKVEDEIDFSENQWYSNNGNFISVTSKGELIKIDENGAVRKEKLADFTDPFFTANEDVLVFHSENNLKINNNTVTLDYGLYTQPEIFTFGNNTFITITDTQAERVFVFNEKAELLPGFPVYGSSRANILSIGKKNFLSVRGDEKGIILYEF